MDQIKAMLGQLTSVVKGVADQGRSLAARLAAIEGSGSARVGEDADPNDVRRFRAIAPEIIPAGGATTGLRGSIPVSSNGLDVSDEFLRLRTPKYMSGSKVLLNFEAISSDGQKSWGEILTSMRTRPSSVGEVLRIQRFSSTHQQWKYAVRFKGLTTGNGNGFYENELLSA